MMNLINEVDDGGRRFGPGYFDLIVIDEAHRSVYAKYGAIFDCFDALLVGLTATPKDEVDHNTYRLFHLEDGVPTDAYSLDEAVDAGYLVPPKGVGVGTKFLRHGHQVRRPHRGGEGPVGRPRLGRGRPPDEVGAEELNRFLFNEDTVDKVLATLMADGLQGRRWRPARQDDHLRQEPEPRRVHRATLRPRLPRARRPLRPGHHPRQALRPKS